MGATLIVIEDHFGAVPSLSKEYFRTSDEAVSRALALIRDEDSRLSSEAPISFTFRIDCDDDFSAMDDDVVRLLALLTSRAARWSSCGRRMSEFNSTTIMRN